MSSATPLADPKALTEVQKWDLEMQAAKRFFEDFHNRGKKVVERFLDERKSDENVTPTGGSRLPLFHSNIVTLKALIYAKLPKVEADRRFADPNDDVARVAGEMITRCLENDLNKADAALKPVLHHAIFDWLVPGLGEARVMYGFEEDKDKVIAIEEETQEPIYGKKDEWCDEVYIHWRDVLWSPCRTYEEMRWKAYRSYMTKEQFKARFDRINPRLVDEVSFTSKGPASINEGVAGQNPVELDRQVEVWEIWDKDQKCVYWWAKGASEMLDHRDDPLGLPGFFPSAQPLAANLTTDRFIPKADFIIAQDIYNQIDLLETRITLLTASCKAVGVYAGESEAVKNMLQEGVENQLIPVDNWAMHAERGGLKGVIEWFPIREVAETLTLLTAQQQQWIQKLYQITGMSDIMRGQASAAGTTATEQKIKAQFGSVRINDLQEQLANFVTDLMNKKVQIIRKFYAPEKILAYSNIMQTPDAQLAEQAIELIKGEEFDFRVIIRSESMAAIDMEALKQERTEFLQAMAQYLGQATQLVTTMPEVMPFLMKMMQFGLSGYKGASEMEGVLDQGIAQMEAALQAKAQQPPQPSPEEKKLQMEGQLKQQEFGMKAQEMQQSAGLEAQKQRFEFQMKQKEFELEKERHAMELQFKREELAMKQRELEMKLQATAAQTQVKIQGDMQKAETDQAIAMQQAETDAVRADAEEDRAERGFEKDQKRADVAAKADAKRASMKPKPQK